MDHPKTSLSFITASIFLKVITININPTFLFPIKNSPPLISILKAHYFWPCGTQHVICRPLTTNSWWEFRSAVFFFLWSWCVFTTLIFIQINCLMLSLKESDSFKQFKNLRNPKSNLIWSQKKGLNSSHRKRYFRAREILEWYNFNWKWKIKISAKI